MPAAPLSPRASGRPGRRVVLGGALGAVMGLGTGCRIRLEDDAPQLPLVPTREPIPAEAALLWLLADSGALARATAERADDYAAQVAVLRTALLRAGVPVETVDSRLRAHVTDPTTPTDVADSESPPEDRTTAVPTAEGEPQAAEAPGEEPDDPAGAALARIDELSRCGAGLFPLVTSVLAQRWAVVTDAGGEPSDIARLPEPARLWRFPHLAIPFGAASQAAAYGLEVVAAQTGDDLRVAAEESLGAVRRLLREQSARSGGSLDDPAAGYVLPFEVASEESAQRLATHVLAGLVDAYGGLLATVTGTPQQDVAVDVVSWLGTAAALGAAWEVPVAAFPGLRQPS
jgi:hypothetical protein